MVSIRIFAAAAVSFALSASLASFGFAQEVPLADLSTQKESGRKFYSAVNAEGATLPAGVVRLRLPAQMAWGKSGFDADGKKRDLGVDLVLTGGSLVVEYGLFDSLSLQVLVPVYFSNDAGIDAKRFRKSRDYKENFEKFISGISKALANSGSVCTSELVCRDLILNKGLALPTALVLPTGEKLLVPNHPVKEAVDSLLVNGAAPRNGRTGLGDVEIGGLWNPLSSRLPNANFPLYFSVGAGLRFPTGHLHDTPFSQRPTSGGTVDLGLRANVDWRVKDGVWISFQNQSEYMLLSGKKRKSSLLNNSRFNTADGTTPDARVSGGDGKGNDQKLERKGVRNVGFVKAAVGLGLLDETLNAVGTNILVKYDMGAREYLDQVRQGDPVRSTALQVGFTLDGLAYALPLQMDIDYSHPLGGENQPVALQTVGVTLKGYYKF